MSFHKKLVALMLALLLISVFVSYFAIKEATRFGNAYCEVEPTATICKVNDVLESDT